jgi:hypothetical protein
MVRAQFRLRSVCKCSGDQLVCPIEASRGSVKLPRSDPRSEIACRATNEITNAGAELELDVPARVAPWQLAQFARPPFLAGTELCSAVPPPPQQCGQETTIRAPWRVMGPATAMQAPLEQWTIPTINMIAVRLEMIRLWAKFTSLYYTSLSSNGHGRIRTFEGVSHQIYSLTRLSTSVRARAVAEYPRSSLGFQRNSLGAARTPGGAASRRMG